MKKLLVIAAVFVFCGQGYAFQRYAGIRSIRALGMGGAFYGLSDDEYALFYNPAGLSVYRGDGQGMLSFNVGATPAIASAIKTVTDNSNSTAATIADKLQEFQGQPLSVNVTPFFPYYLHKNFAIGLLVADTKLDFALLGRDIDTSVDIAAVSDSGLFIGYGTDFLNETLHLGVVVKGMVRAGGKKTFTVADIAQKDDFDLDVKKLGGAGAGFDFDLGGTYELPELPFGILSRASLVFNNILGSKMTMAQQGSDPPGLPRTMSLGWYTVFEGWQVFDNFHALVDFAEFRLGGEDDPAYGAQGGSFWKHVNLGVEAPMNGWFVPRLGFHQGYLSAGFGLNLRAMRIDFATYQEELSSSPGRLSSRMYAIRLQLGWGAASPEPITHSARNRPPEEKEKKEEKKEEKPAEATKPEKKKPEATPAPSPSPSPTPTPSVSPSPTPSPTVTPSPTPIAKSKRKPNELDPVESPQVDDIPRAPQSSEELPVSKGTPSDRFGIDKMKEETPSTP